MYELIMINLFSVNMIYLDYNATTPLEEEVLEAITDTLRDAWGNPSSSYEAGMCDLKKL